MGTQLLALDTPRPLPRAVWVWRAVVLAVCAAGVAAVVSFASVVLRAVPAVGLLHAVLGAFVSGITALLMLDHARTTRRRGFLAIAVTYLYLACVLAVFPLTFPGAFTEDGALIGTIQTPVGFFFAWHFAVPVGLSVAAVLLYRDEARHRRPSLTSPQIRASVLICGLGVGLTVLLALNWPVLGLPELLGSAGVLMGFSSLLKVVALLLSICFLVIAAYCARNGSVILGWLGAVAVLGAAEAVISLFSMQRFTLGWYASRVVWLVAVSVLLFVLIRSLSRVADANVALGAVDALTGVASRSTFLRILGREVRRSRIDDAPVTLFWLNIDRFKEVNDQMGQDAGDEVLRCVARRIGGRLGESDAIGRLGGDQFGILLTQSGDRESVQGYAEVFLDEVRQPIALPEATLQVTAALGIARSGRDAVDADGLMQCADLAMLAARAAGGDRSVCFEQELGAEAMAKVRIRRELVEGLRAGEFSLFYQPIHEVPDLRMAGVEALARWRRGSTILPAAQWVPVAESTGQIVAVAHQLLACLVADLPRWIADRGEDFFVTLNVSSQELSDGRYVDALIDALAPHSQNILIEVTESLEMQESSDAGRNLQKLRSQGLRVAIDDFGTGFSNISRLERLRPTLLKTDRSLLQRVSEDDSHGTAVLAAACTMARALGCDVVVEGVETRAEAAAAQAVGGKYVQGYLYGRPAPMEDWLSSVAAQEAASGR